MEEPQTKRKKRIKKCEAFGCDKNESDHSDVSFHEIPQRIDL